MKQILLFSLVMLLSACSINPYAEFYRGEQDAPLAGHHPGTDPLQIYSSDNVDRDVTNLNAKGYVVIGRTSFDSESYILSESQLREEADKIGAQAVLVSSKYSHQVSGLVPLNVPQSNT